MNYDDMESAKDYGSREAGKRQNLFSQFINS